MDVTYICPESKTTKRGSVIIKKTAVIEVPRGCTVRTRDWIVPPIIQTKTITSKIAENDKNLLPLGPWNVEKQTASSSKDQYYRQKLLDKVSTQLATLTSDDQAHQLHGISIKRLQHLSPLNSDFYWSDKSDLHLFSVYAVSIGFLLLAAITVRLLLKRLRVVENELYALSKRMKDHERLESLHGETTV